MSDYQSVYHIPIYIFAESGGHYVRLSVCVSHTYIYLQSPEATMSDYQSVHYILIYICRVLRPLCQTTSLCITYLYIFAESGGHYVRLPVCVSQIQGNGYGG